MQVDVSFDEAERALLAFLERRATGGDAVRLDDVCDGRPELLSVVRDLYRRHDEAAAALSALGGALRRPVGDEAHSGDDTTDRYEPDRYEVVREVGHGGMGTILEVRDRKLRRTLAMKVVREEPPSGDPSIDALRAARRRARLLEEAQVLAQLDHPGVPPVHDVGCNAEGRVYFTMPLVRGQDLGALLAARARSDAAASERNSTMRLIDVLLRVAEAVDHAHAKGVLHRDLKPENVMLDAHGGVLVLDWGLARVFGSVSPDLRVGVPVTTDRSDEPGGLLRTLEGDAVGTPSYMAPEQARGELDRIDARTDVYALGAMLYEVLAEAPPYAECTGGAQGVLLAVRARPPRPLASVARDAPPELVAIAERAMHREPDERYASLGDLAGELRAFLEGRVVRAHRTGAWIELEKWIRRNRATATAIAITGVAAIALGAQQAVTARERGRLNAALEVELYRSKIAVAQRALDQDDVAAAQDALRACPTTLRGWEWLHLARTVDTSDRVFSDHEGADVRSVAWSPDGSTLVSGDAQGRIRARAVHAEGEWVEFSAGNPESWRCELLRFSPSGDVLLQYLPLRRWRWSPGSKEHGRLLGEHAQAFQSAAWIDDERYVATDLTALRVFDASSDLESQRQEMPTRDGRVLLTTKDGQRIVVGDERGVLRVYTAADATPIGELATGVGSLLALDASADGHWLVVAGLTHEVLVVDFASLTIAARLPRARAHVIGLAMAPDGCRIASASGPIVDVWRGSGSSWTHEARLVGHSGAIQAVAFDATGRWVASGADDGTIRTWDLSKPGRGGAGTHLGARGELAWSPDGATLAVSDRSESGGVDLVDGGSGAFIGALPFAGGIHSLAWSRAGVLAGSASEGRIVLWRPPDPTPFATARVSELPFAVTPLAFSPDGDLLAFQRVGGAAAYRWSTGEVLWLQPGAGNTRALTYSPDGSTLAWASSHGTRGSAGLLDAVTGDVIGVFADEDVHLTFSSWSPDGRWVTVGGSSASLVTLRASDRSVAWRVDAAQRSISPSHAPDGERLFAGTFDGSLDVRNAASGELLASFRRHGVLVLDCAVSPDGTRVATLDNSGVLWIHDARPWSR